MSTDRQLIDAVNLLCQYVDENLPRGWEITLTMRNGEAEATLTDPFGEDVWTDAADYNVSTLRDMCDTAKEREAA